MRAPGTSAITDVSPAHFIVEKAEGREKKSAQLRKASWQARIRLVIQKNGKRASVHVKGGLTAT